MAIGFVRPARPGDAAGIARIQLLTWRTAYRRLLPPHVLNDLDEEWTTEKWRDAIVTPPTFRHRVLVAVEQIEPPPTATPPPSAAEASITTEAGSAYLVGFAATGPADEAALAPDEPADAIGPDVAAFTELLVEPRWGRRGHGSRLLAAAVDLWRSDGFTTAVAWTFVSDQATRRFLGGAGWAEDGAKRSLDVDDLLVPQIRLHTSISIDDVQPGLSVT